MGNSLFTYSPFSPMQSGKKRILCVEDNFDAREIITYYMSEAGYDVIFADGVADGIQFARDDRFDLYMIDERLPDGSGTELARQIRAFDSTTPLIFHSAITATAYIQRWLAAGAQAYLTKPADPFEVIEVVRTLINISEQAVKRTSH